MRIFGYNCISKKTEKQTQEKTTQNNTNEKTNNGIEDIINTYKNVGENIFKLTSTYKNYTYAKNAFDSFMNICNELTEKTIELTEPFMDTRNAIYSEYKEHVIDPAADFLKKSNYIASSFMSGESFSFGKVEELNKNWETLKEQKRQGFKISFDDSISNEDMNKAMELGIAALEERQAQNMQNFPQYGDCKSYYNEGSLADWVLTHPVSFGWQWSAKENNEDWYTNLNEDILGRDGMFTLTNIPSYIFNSDNGIKQDDISDMLAINSTKTIKKDLDKQAELIEALKTNKNNPEKFAYLYYIATNGVNFNPNQIIDYIENLDTEYSYTEVYGRDYTKEDIAKNRMGTNILFDVNKTVGTQLCKMIPFVGPLAALAVNFGITKLDNETQGENEEKQTTTEIITSEGARTLVIFGADKISKFCTSKINLPENSALGKFLDNGTRSTVSSNITNVMDTAGKIIDEKDGTEFIGNGINAGTQWQATLKGGLKTLFSLIFGK